MKHYKGANGIRRNIIAKTTTTEVISGLAHCTSLDYDKIKRGVIAS